MRNKKRMVKVVTCSFLLLTLCVFAFTGCSSSDRQATFSLKNAVAADNESLAAEFAREKDGITLIRDGRVVCSVLYPENSSAELVKAAEFLGNALSRMSGSAEEVAVVPESAAPAGTTISVGDTSLSSFLDLSAIKNDGYRIYSTADVLFIKGLDDDGTRNGIYDFLETRLECMFVSPERDYIPVFPTVILPAVDETVNPSFAWRRIYQYEVTENEWFEKLRLNGCATSEDGGSGIELYNEWGTWSHQSFEFVPPEIYFDEHPEYYSLYLGKRRYQTTIFGKTFYNHLCYTNPDVYEIVKKGLIERIEANPDVKYWDISIMDTHLPMCQCDNCKAINKKYKSEISTLLLFINRLGDDIKDEYPSVKISTLAYQACQDPPVGIVCADNVAIKVCAFFGSQSYAYGSSPSSRESRKVTEQIESWSKICKHILVWDYVVNYDHLFLPFPNFEVQKDNLDFYLSHNIEYVFHQGSREPDNELANMRSYLLSRQLWNKDVDLPSLAKKYVAALYGDAAPFVEEYLDLQNEILISSGKDLGIYDSVVKHSYGYLSSDAVNKYLDLTGQALALADETNLKDVELLRANALYAKMVCTDWDYSGKKAALSEFRVLCEKYGFTNASEHVSMSDFLDKTYPWWLVWTVAKPVLTALGVLAFIVLCACLIAFSPLIGIYIRLLKSSGPRNRKLTGRTRLSERKPTRD